MSATKSRIAYSLASSAEIETRSAPDVGDSGCLAPLAQANDPRDVRLGCDSEHDTPGAFSAIHSSGFGPLIAGTASSCQTAETLIVCPASAEVPAWVARQPLARRIALAQAHLLVTVAGPEVRFNLPIPPSEEQAAEMTLDYAEFAMAGGRSIIPAKFLTERGVREVALAARASLPAEPVLLLISAAAS
jgi:hypothetical protein